ncbi:unnamed protein product [Candidula unifasciata]|uniref:Inhibitor of nuclear factor kappa-B kinase subunit epsilon n=1 Tax=Candidula unifasciata TaxID=100452 RepID=A0A8S3YZZ3_9EUPU|nr:unnamed protein product [Candidula unifasciata]
MATIRGSNTYVWDTTRLLGQGATSAVYMGRNKRTGDEVAVKVFNSQSFHRPFVVQNREFDVMTKLKHDNIVKLLAIEEEMTSRTKVIVMEYCTHGTLYNLLDQPENAFGLSEEEFLLVLSQVTAGVKHLRDNDIIHRDIKPGNILRSVAQDGRSVYKLTDFGAARELQQDEEFFSLYGTDEYLHPDMYERAVLRRPRGQQFGVYVDLWSLGVTFYHAATGNLPFRPYGGRKNKETMHLITAKKEHGVISGVQEQQDGPIKYSRDLPLTCRLSKVLTLGAWEHFIRGSDLFYHMFCTSMFSQIVVYIRQKDDMSQLRQLITDQTEIPGGAQLLMHDGKVLKDDSRNPVIKYLKHSTADNPIFIFNKLPEYKRFTRPVYGTFVDIPLETNVVTDYPISKRCFSVLHSVKNCVKILMLNNMFLTKAVKMYCNYVRSKSIQLELSTGYATRMCTDTKTWQDQLFSNLSLQTKLSNGLDFGGRLNVLQTLLETGKRECSQISAQVQNRLDKATKHLQDLKTAQALDDNWDPSVGCLPSDRCNEKMEHLLQRMQKIMNSFREDRSKAPLSNNDEQVHRFDKNKMKELCLMAQTLVDDDCTKKANQLYSAFKQLYSKAVQIHDTGERLEALVSDISHMQGRLVDKLKVSGNQCISQLETCLKAVDVPENHTDGVVTNKGDNSNSSNGVTMGSRQERLDSVLGSIQTTCSSLEEVRILLSENTSLIEKFNSLGETTEDDKSWEYVP